MFYHRTMRCTTGMTPLARRDAGWENRRPDHPDPDVIAEAFRWSVTQEGHQDRDGVPAGQHLPADPMLAGTRIELVYDPFDLTGPVAVTPAAAWEAVLLEIRRHVLPRPSTPPKTPTRRRRTRRPGPITYAWSNPPQGHHGRRPDQLSRHQVIYIADPTIGMRGIQSQIVTALGGQPAFYSGDLAHQTASLLAVELDERARLPVVVIDEAHLLGNTELESLRMLTNTGMDTGSHFALLLVGQPTLRRRLKLAVLAALDQRISTRFAITGMDLAETADYIRHHLKFAGHRPDGHETVREDTHGSNG